MSVSPQKTTSTIEQRLGTIRSRIQSACQKHGRDPKQVQLLAVSKGQSCLAIREAYRLGIRDFGENYVQEFLQKQRELADLTDIRWHFIGNLQSNKIKQIVPATNLSCVHSIDRASFFEIFTRKKLNMGVRRETLDVLIQLEVDPRDKAKFGIKKREFFDLSEILYESPDIRWRGFMGIGPKEATSEELSEIYKKFYHTCNILWENFSKCHDVQHPTISLGMSSDLEVAIGSGSTIIRVGSDLFGPRHYPRVEDKAQVANCDSRVDLGSKKSKMA